jgi:hypothetical protein
LLLFLSAVSLVGKHPIADLLETCQVHGMINSAPVILTVVAGGLAIWGIVKPQWPITAVAVFLLSVAMFVFLRGGK